MNDSLTVSEVVERIDEALRVLWDYEETLNAGTHLELITRESSWEYPVRAAVIGLEEIKTMYDNRLA